MPLRRFIIRSLLCAAFMLASSYVQAMSHVDELQSAATHSTGKAKLPPCHQTMKHDKSDESGHHHGCCSNFACAIGLIVEFASSPHSRAASIHSIDYGTSKRSGIERPLNPPPKTF